MGLLDDLKDSLPGQDGADPSNNGIMDAVMGLVNHSEGGLSGLVDKFQAGGLGDLVGSWVGKGENLGISAGQIKDVLGSDFVSGLAAKLGIDPGEAASGLASILPMIIDKLTPDGKVEQGASGGLGGLVDMIKDKLNG